MHADRDDILRSRGKAEARFVLRCTNCMDEIATSIAEQAGWTYWSDGTGDLLPFCPACAQREFGRKPHPARPPA